MKRQIRHLIAIAVSMLIQQLKCCVWQVVWRHAATTFAHILPPAPCLATVQPRPIAHDAAAWSFPASPPSWIPASGGQEGSSCHREGSAGLAPWSSVRGSRLGGNGNREGS